MKRNKKVQIRNFIEIFFLIFVSTLFFLVFLELIFRIPGVYDHKKELPYAENIEQEIQHRKLFRISRVQNIDYEPVYNHSRKLGFASDFKSREFEINKPREIFRIIGIGDSHMQGYNEFDLTTKLERRLNSLPFQKRVEVLNFGVGGYNLIKKKILFEEKIIKYDPDVLIIQLLDADCNSEMIFLEGSKILVDNVDFTEIKEGVIIPLSLPFPRDLNKWLVRRSKFFEFTSIKLYYILKQRSEKIGLQESHFIRCDKALNEIFELAEKNNIEVIVFVSHSILYDIAEYPKYPYEMNFVKWYEQKKIPMSNTLFLRDYISEYNYEDIKVDWLGHYSGEIYEIANRIIYEEILSRYYINNTLFSVIENE